MKKKTAFTIFICLCVIIGCGYTTKSTLPGNYKTLYVETFENKISYTNQGGRELYFPLLEVKVRNAIIDRFLFDGNLKISKSEDADLVLRGSLTGYQRNALRYDESNNVEEYRVSVIVSLVLWDTQKDQPFWEESSFAGEAEYFLTGSLATSEESTVDKATVDLARRIVERTIENW